MFVLICLCCQQTAKRKHKNKLRDKSLLRNFVHFKEKFYCFCTNLIEILLFSQNSRTIFQRVIYPSDFYSTEAGSLLLCFCCLVIIPFLEELSYIRKFFFLMVHFTIHSECSTWSSNSMYIFFQKTDYSTDVSNVAMK